jgi:predicted RecB family nuclease
MKITNQIVEAYLNCKYKAYLLLKGETGTPHDYEVLMDELQAEYRPKATETLLRRCKLQSAPSIPSLTLDHLLQGHPLILDCTVEDEKFQFHLDALEKIEGKSSLGQFHYHPVLFQHDDSLREIHRTLLALPAIVLGAICGHTPSTGIFVYGAKCRRTTAKLDKHNRSIRLTLDMIEAITGSTMARVMA